MGEEADRSWIRAAFSNTVYQRSCSSSSITPIRTQPEEASSPIKSDCSPKTPATNKEVSVSPHSNDVGDTFKEVRAQSKLSRTKTLSPHSQTAVPDTFKEARAQSRLTRNNTMVPQPKKKEQDKGIMWKLLHNDFLKPHKPSLPKQIPHSSIFRHFASVKLDGRKGCKDLEWTKYFEHGGGMVTTSEAADQHMVDLSQLFLGLRFAHGAHSKLYHGIYNDEPVAVKIITVPDDDDEDKSLEVRLKKQFIGEVNLLCRLQHENVIKFVAACSKPPVYCIVTEYLPEGCLRTYLHKPENKNLSLKVIVAFALEITRAMEYIHSQGVIHRDLKPENILISESLHMKIADFGNACDGGDCDPFEDDPGTYRWMAPEMIKHKTYGRKVDVYSFGLILWEMVSGSIPYENMNPVQAAYAVVNKHVRPPFPEDCPEVMRTLIEQCWHSQPDKRPEFSQIVKVLEQFESSVAVDGTLNLVQNITFQENKKGLAHWIHKHSLSRSNSFSKPKFSF